MPDTPETAKRLSSYPPEEYNKISGTYAIEENSRILKFFEGKDLAEYDLTKWEHVGIILNFFKTWQTLPNFVQRQLRQPLMNYIRQNLPLDNNQLRQKIWELSTPILKEFGLMVEVEEESDKKRPGEYAVIDIRVVKTQKALLKCLDKPDDKCGDSEPPTMPETRISKLKKAI